jgi:hypothetical protein
MLGAVLRACSVMPPPLMNCAQDPALHCSVLVAAGNTQRRQLGTEQQGTHAPPTLCVVGSQWVLCWGQHAAAAGGLPALTLPCKDVKYDGVRRIENRQKPLRSRIMPEENARRHPAPLIQYVLTNSWGRNEPASFSRVFWTVAVPGEYFLELAPRAVQNVSPL